MHWLNDLGLRTAVDTFTCLPSSPNSSKAFASSSGVGAGARARTALCRKGVFSAALVRRGREGPVPGARSRGFRYCCSIEPSNVSLIVFAVLRSYGLVLLGDVVSETRQRRPYAGGSTFILLFDRNERLKERVELSRGAICGKPHV